ncbi:hypothetical protein [Marivita cryptomonadis]
MIGNLWEWTADCWNGSASRATADGGRAGARAAAGCCGAGHGTIRPRTCG